MDKLVGYVFKPIESDGNEIWFRLLVPEDKKAEHTKEFDCRISLESMTVCEDVSAHYKNLGVSNSEMVMNMLPIGRYVELDGYMMFDYVERGVMSIWFSVWTVSVGASDGMVTVLKSKENPPD